MIEPSDIEKKSLEAHVELCAERFRALYDRIDAIDVKICVVSATVNKVHDILQSSNQKDHDRLLSWGISIIGVLIATIGWLLVNYVFK